MAQQYTNFCCRSGGSNLNAGTLTGNDTVPGTSASYTYASGNWVAGTGVFTVASGNPSSDGVAVGDWASVYPNGSTVTPFVGRITARDATTITVSLTVKGGTAPTNGTGDRTLKVGGAWRGPDSTTVFPFIDFIHTAMKDSTGRFPRVNFKNDVTYQIFSPGAIKSSFFPSQITFQGFSSTYGDFGKAEIRGDPSAPTAYTMIILQEGGGGTAITTTFKDFILGSNGDEGAAGGSGHSHQGLLSYAGLALRCSANNNWISSYDFNGICVEGECYDYNFGGASNMGAWVGSVLNLRCIAHHSNPLPHPYDITGIPIAGFHTNYCCFACIAANCHGAGWDAFSILNVNCDSHDNDLAGIEFRQATLTMNCSATENGDDGFQFGAGTVSASAGEVITCRYGAGTQANGGGGSVDAPATDVSAYPTDLSPWVDADNGNFTIALDNALETGRGSFTQTSTSYTATSQSHPDIGAARHQTNVANLFYPISGAGGMA